MPDKIPDLPANSPADETIREVLRRYRTIAVVGASRNPEKPSHFVPQYLQEQGYRIIPVNPSAREPLLGEKVYASLSEIPEEVEVVDIFRPPEAIPPIVQEAISVGAKVIWMQEGITHPEAERQALHAGLTVIMDRCIMKEHRRLIGPSRI